MLVTPARPVLLNFGLLALLSPPAFPVVRVLVPPKLFHISICPAPEGPSVEREGLGRPDLARRQPTAESDPAYSDCFSRLPCGLSLHNMIHHVSLVY